MVRSGSLVAGLAVVIAGLALFAQQPPVTDKPQPAGTAVDLKPLTTAFLAAFDAGDAKAIAPLWTADAEMVTAAGETLRGRDAIRDAYADLFKKRPKVKAEVVHGEVRSLGPTVAVAEGVLKLALPGEAEPDVTLFRALCVREGDAWKFAAVQSFDADPEAATLADLDWLVGDWAGKAADGELRASYAWEDGKTFLRCRYTTTRDGKALGGSQMIGADPDGGVRGWLFDASGAVGESRWTKDGSRWVIASSGTLPDGTKSEAMNVLVPLGKDAFTWQTVARTSDGRPEPDLKPIKMTRVPGK